MDSFIAWIGRKKLLRKKILEQFPPENEIGRYIEVFGGAGWVLFGKEEGKYLEVFNDTDGNLINLFRCVKYHREALQKELAYSFCSREQFVYDLGQLKLDVLTDVQRAACFYHVIKTSFGADRRTFGAKPQNFEKCLTYLGGIERRLSRVVIEKKDFENLINVYDRPNALFYCDPPYHKTEKYYDSVFTQQDHIRLRDALLGSKGKFVLSYNDDAFIRELYSGFKMEEVNRTNNLEQRKKKGQFRELIIKNY